MVEFISKLPPKEIRRSGESGLVITWADSTSSKLNSERLRKNCPCATCREMRGDGGSHSSPLTPPKKSLLKIVESSSAEELALTKVWAVGTYAIGLEWRDNHNSGIYPFNLLLNLAEGDGSMQS